MLSIKKLLLLLLITSTFVAPMCYANQATYQSNQNEQLKNQIHNVLWQHKEAFNLKDWDANSYHLFDQDKTFKLVDASYETRSVNGSMSAPMLIDHYPAYYANYFKTNGSNYAVYHGYQKENGDGSLFSIFARVPEQPDKPLLFIKVLKQNPSGYFALWGAEYTIGYKISFAEFDPISNTMSAITNPFYLPKSQLAVSPSNQTCPTENNNPIDHDDEWIKSYTTPPTPIIHDMWEDAW